MKFFALGRDTSAWVFLCVRIVVMRYVLEKNQRSLKTSLPVDLVSRTPRTTATMIQALATTAAETPTKIFFAIGHLQHK